MSPSRTLSRRALGLVLALLAGGPAAHATIPDTPVVAAAKPKPPPGPRPPTVPIEQIPALFETDPVAGPRDAADDPAIWIHPWDRSQSLVIGTDKAAKNLEVYDLTGRRLQRIPDASGSLNNLDVRYGFPLGGQYVDIVVTGGGDIAVYKIDPFTRQLVDITAGTITPAVWAWGICLYRSNISGLFYAFAQATESGLVEQLELFDNGFGQVAARSVRGPWDIHPEPVKVEDGEVEACVADDLTGDYYVGEQDVGVWRYGAEPTASTLERTLVVSTYLVNGGAMVPDLEGIAVIHDDFGTFLLTSSQGDSSFGLYSVDPLAVPYPLIRKFRITNGPYADGCSITDGLDATSLWLGPQFPHGMFVCQDDRNTAPGTAGTQNFKLVPLERIIPGINPYFM
jgi:myo-inositol-hexaphosphate 3-phosphohydrolase